jgi:hypothetical protein
VPHGYFLTIWVEAVAGQADVYLVIFAHPAEKVK